MQPDMLFFLGVFYTLFGGLVVAGWLLTRSPWNLYGAVMLVIGLLLVAVRPKPPLRFFIGRVSAEEHKDIQHHCRHVEPQSGLPRLRPDDGE